MFRNFYLTFLFIIISINFSYADDLMEADEAQIHQLIHQPLFVSLGSVCEVTHTLRACGLRKAAFPFDWITTIDSEKFLDILRDDFRFFLDETCFCVGDRGPGPLLNMHYYVEFLHEGDFRGDLYAPNMQKLQSKYQRRIERFRNLATYQGKVFFLRTSFRYSTTDPHRYFFCADNLEISDQYASNLFDLLSERFPNLDFTLIIINHDEGKEVYEEKRLKPNLIKIRSSPTLEISTDFASYKKFFNALLSEN